MRKYATIVLDAHEIAKERVRTRSKSREGRDPSPKGCLRGF